MLVFLILYQILVNSKENLKNNLGGFKTNLFTAFRISVVVQTNFLAYQVLLTYNY